MNHRSARLPVVSILVVLAACLLLTGTAQAGWRLMGSVGARTYGYEDAYETDHLWLIQNTSLTVLQTGGPLSIHFSGNYLGDNEDDFSESGRARLTKGYLQYGRIGSPMMLKAGRLFIARGVAIGVFDGLDAQVKVNDLIRVSAFAGLIGPYNRQFELSAPDKSMSYGAEVKLSPSKCLLPAKGMIALSYVRTQRDGESELNLMGLQTYHRFLNMPLTWMNIVQLRPTDSPFRRLISRARYLTPSFNLMGEFGFIGFDAPNYSWFSDLGVSPRTRIRVAGDYYLVPSRWAVGGETQMLVTSGSGGFRGGPVVTSPWGRAGYRISAQDQGSTSGPWVSLHYRATDELVAYFHWQKVSYEWDAFDIETEELTQMLYGGRYTPSFASSLTLSLQVQVYTTPEFSYDQRMLAGLAWRFDTGRTGR